MYYYVTMEFHIFQPPKPQQGLAPKIVLWLEPYKIVRNEMLPLCM